MNLIRIRCMYEQGVQDLYELEDATNENGGMGNEK